jgi:hypothetical protein
MGLSFSEVPSSMEKSLDRGEETLTNPKVESGN